MAPLPGSPNKTLLKVEKYLDSSTLVKLIEALPIFGEILVKLAQASPSFVETLAPLIFKNVDLTNKGYKAHLEKTDTFMGCIEELPILPTYIETFSARDKSCFGDASGDEGGKVDPFPDWIPWVLRTESLSRLTKLELNGAGIRIEDVVNLMFVGQVKELTVAYDYLTTHYIQDGWESFSCRSAGTSPLLALDLGHMSLVGDMLQHILIWPKALQKLRCNLARGTSEGIIVVDENSNEQGTSFKTMNFGSSVDPFMEEVRTSKGIMEFRQIYHRLPEWHTRDPLPPGTLVKALELIKDSLVELVVVDHWDDKTRLVERMCLSEFSSLQALNVPLDCLYYLDGLVPSFRPPQTLLPRSLKHLKVLNLRSYPIIFAKEVLLTCTPPRLYIPLRGSQSIYSIGLGSLQC